MLDHSEEVGPFEPIGAILNNFSEAEGFFGHDMLILNVAKEV